MTPSDVANAVNEMIAIPADVPNEAKIEIVKQELMRFEANKYRLAVLGRVSSLVGGSTDDVTRELGMTLVAIETLTRLLDVLQGRPVSPLSSEVAVAE